MAMDRELLLQNLESARMQTDALFGLVRPEAVYERPIPERHRIVFYIGHLETFDWNLIGRRFRDLPAFAPALDQLFAFGIDPAVGTEQRDQPSDWPVMDEVRRYVAQVRERLGPVLAGAPEQALHAALEHRLMHAETFAYMLHHLPLEQKIRPALPSVDAPAPALAMVEIPAGSAVLGRSREHGFGWDNEFEAHAESVPAFALDKYKVTNGQFLKFVEQGAAPPRFWRRENGGWLYRTMFGEIPLPLSWPVYVTHDQAQQYAAWKGKQLPTEAQFHRAAYGAPHGPERAYPWGDEAPDATRGNFDFHSWDPAPVTAHPQGESAFGASQMLGNGWEWTSTVFGPFEGFEPFPFYPGYSADFFDGAHYVAKGASARTAAPLLRRSFRNWFRRDYPYVYAGFRCVEN
jgi:iron(II)-dependent oxidoreductase